MEVALPDRWIFVRVLDAERRTLYIFPMFKPGDKVVVFKLDGTEVHGVVVLAESFTTGVKVRVRSGDFILNVDEKQVAKNE